jgi:predicted permease
MGTLIQDLRYAGRTLLHSKGFAAVAILSLALGIGANTTVFTMINVVFLRPLPLEEMDRLVELFTVDERNRGGFNDYNTTSNPNFEDYRDQSSSFTGMAAFSGIGLSLSGAGEPEQIGGMIASGNYFSLLGAKPALGRFFLPEEDGAPGAHLVTVLSHPTWKKRFASDPGIVGKAINLNGYPFTVIGVSGAGFSGTSVLFTPELWVPMSAVPQVLSGFMAENFRDRRALLFNVVGRLRPGVTIEQAGAEIKAIAQRLERDYPEPNHGRSAILLPAAQTTINPALRRIFTAGAGLLMTVVALVLLIACANVANLLLARATARRKEIAVRLSVGASRGRLIRQLMTESLLLSVVGGALGLLLAAWGKDLILAFQPPQLFAGGLELPLDGRVLGFTLIVSLLTGALFGLAPALQASRLDLVTELKDRSTLSQRGGRRFNLRGALVAAQVALSLVALVGAGLLVRSLRNMQGIDPGFDTRGLLFMSFDLAGQRYDQPRAEEFHRRLLEEVGATPGVRSAALSSALPLFGGGFMRTVFPEGVEPTAGGAGVFASINEVSPAYFDTLGIELRRGRLFTDADRPGAPLAVVVNETMAQRFWPGQEAVGKRFKFFGDTEFREVVGVVENTKVFALAEDPTPIAFQPLLQAYSSNVTLNVRAAGDPAALLATIRRQVQSLEPTMPLTGVQTVSQLIHQSLWIPRLGAALMTLFGVIALALAAVGIYGVMAYTVGQRTHEFGVRMALGAQPGDVLRLVLRQGMARVGIGLAIGLVAALASTRLIASLLVEVDPLDPVTFFTISILLLAVAALAGYLPARRATRVDPLIALRAE